MTFVYSKLQLFLNNAQTLINTFLHITDHGIQLIPLGYPTRNNLPANATCAGRKSYLSDKSEVASWRAN